MVMTPQQLHQLEDLSRKLYNAEDADARRHAEAALASFHVSPEHIPQDQFILDNSVNPYALMLASQSLSTLITTHWNSFSVQQRVDIRNYVLTYLANRGPKLAHYVRSRLIELVCIITKLGWFDDRAHRDLPTEVTKFLEASTEYAAIGLHILNRLVAEIMDNKKHPVADHRKICVSFRDNSLFHVFQVSLTTLKQLQQDLDSSMVDPVQQDQLKAQALSLAIACLSFDFNGTYPDEASVWDDLNTIQAPATWRGVFEEAETMELFFRLYRSSEPPRSARTLEALVLLASVRRSIFTGDKERGEFLTRLLAGLRDILHSGYGLNDKDNYHMFCRLLARVKVTYQLKELANTPGYSDFMEATAHFTISSFGSWEWSPNSLFYLLSLWSRLISSVPYLKDDIPALVDGFAPQIIKAFIHSKLAYAQENPEENCDERLDETGAAEHLDSFSTIARCSYVKSAAIWMECFAPLLNQLQQGLVVTASHRSAEAMHALFVVEAQLSWLVYMAGAILGSRSSVNSGDEPDSLDAELSCRVVNLIRIHDRRVESLAAGGAEAADLSPRLDLAFVYFLHQMRRAYCMDSSVSNSKFYRKMQETSGVGEPTVMLNMIVSKLGFNLKHWRSTPLVIEGSLSTLHAISCGYTGLRMLVKLDSIRTAIQAHTHEHFPFMEHPENGRNRTLFYATLGRVLFHESSEFSFDEFMQPFKQVLTYISQTLENAGVAPPDQQLRFLIIGVLRDLRGVMEAVGTKKVFGRMFDWLFPAWTPLFVRLAQLYYQDPDVTTPLLKFWCEVVCNRQGRLQFDNSSPNGILLFRETSKLLVAYGVNILSLPVRDDLYREKFKGISICLNTFTHAISGNFVNFGVFKLYGDTALEEALTVVIKMCLSVPITEMMAYPKVSKAYFALLEVLCKDHTSAVFELPSQVFNQLVTGVAEGLKGFDVATTRAQCYSAIDHLACYIFDQEGKESERAMHVKNHIAAAPDTFPRLMAMLFDQAIFEANVSQLALSRALISLIVINYPFFEQLRDSLVASQPLDRQERLMNAFLQLMDGVERSTEMKNRNKFNENLGVFRREVRAFIA